MINYKIITALVLLAALCYSPLAYSQMTEQDKASLQKYAVEESSRSAREEALLRDEARRLEIPLRVVKDDRTLVLKGIYNGRPVYEANYNTASQSTSSADQVKTNGNLDLDLTGVGVRIGIWEAFDGNGNAIVRTSHDEFDGRATSMDGAGFSNHATHVAGTMIAAGVDPSAEGYATAAELDTYNSSGDTGEMAAAASAGDPIVISNHSYGYIVGWDFNGTTNMWEYNGGGGTTEDWLFGAYTNDTRSWDETAYNATHLLIVKSAGNDRGDGPNVLQPGDPERDGGPDGFECLPARGTAKNIVTVGATQPNFFGNYTQPGDVVMTVFSSWGPTDDGRIKPDISADGSQLYSSRATADDAYGFSSGTSMSAPSVSGGAALLYEHWDNTLGGTPRAATMKGLLLESADEAGASDGPDYSFGWGAMNVADAAHIVTVEGFEGCDHYAEGSLDADEVFEFTIESSGESLIKAMLVWHDPAATNTNGGTLNPNASYLVNDLDLRIIGNGTTYMPWVMDPANPNNAATRGDNSRDNVEQVLMLEPEAGTYTIRVQAPASVTDGPQAFSLWWIGNDATNDEILVNNVTFNAGDSERYAADLRVLFADGPAPGTVTLNAGADVESFAGEEIRLRPGFHAQSGSHFLAQIQLGGGCGAFTADRKRDNYPSLMPLVSSNTAPPTVAPAPKTVLPEATVTDLKVTPNPARDQVVFSYTLNQETAGVLQVFNALGQPVYQEQLPADKDSSTKETKLDCSTWPTGLYYLTVRTPTGIEQQAFVVE